MTDEEFYISSQFLLIFGENHPLEEQFLKRLYNPLTAVEFLLKTDDLVYEINHHNARISLFSSKSYHYIIGEGDTPAIALMNAYVKFKSGVNPISVDLEKLVSYLELSVIGKCTCGIQTPEHRYHYDDCLYRIIVVASEVINSMRYRHD